MWDLSRYADNTALLDDAGVSVTYAGLAQTCERLAEAIGDRTLVIQLCRNTVGSVAGYTAFIEHRIVPMLLSAQLTEAMRNELIGLYGPSFLYLPEDMRDEYPEWIELCRIYDYVLLRDTTAEEKDLYGELALLLTTSGSTGSPKFVRQSYENIRSNTSSIVEYLNLDESESPITTLPMNYTYGLSIINTHLAVGGTILLTEQGLMQKGFWSFFKDAGATSFGGVPYTYEMLHKLRFSRMELKSLRTMTQAGGKLSEELHREFAAYAKETGRKFVVMYGQCEATARMGYLPPEKALDKCGSMGIAIPGGRFSLIDDDGIEITEEDKPGELIYEGANVTLGYAESPEDLSLGDERGGILQTGDMARRDADGYYYIVGRKKRFLKIYGNRVNLDEIDRMIRSRFDGMDCASAGSDDHMVIYITDESFRDKVREYVSHETGLNPAAFRTVYIAQIPRNEAGKVLYRELQG